MIKLPIALQSLAGIVVGAGVLLTLACIDTLAPAFDRRAPSESGVSQDTEPILEIDRSQWNFGNLDAGAVAEARFVIRNAGHSRLILQRTNGACRCAAQHRPPVIIPPGRQHAIIGRLDTAGACGSISSTIHFQTNAPARPRLSLSCQATIAAE